MGLDAAPGLSALTGSLDAISGRKSLSCFLKMSLHIRAMPWKEYAPRR
jgi:hypothetical protein